MALQTHCSVSFTYSIPISRCVGLVFRPMVSCRPFCKSRRLLAQSADSPSPLSSPPAGQLPVKKRRRSSRLKSSTPKSCQERSLSYETSTKSTSPKLGQSDNARAPSGSSSSESPENTSKKSDIPLVGIYPAQHADMAFSSFETAHLMRLVSWNVTSLRSLVRSGALNAYVSRERPHILCIQESKMTVAAEKDFGGVPGYSVHWNHSERKGYSGVAAFVRDDIAPIIVRVERGMGDAIADAEGRVLTLFLTKSMCIVNAYVPNSGGKLARLEYRTTIFEATMRRFLEDLAKEYYVIYCGDLNVAYEEIDIHNSKGNVKSAGHTPQEREQFGVLLQHGPTWVDCYRKLYPSYHGYTYYSRRFGTRLREQGKGWRLDYFLLDKNTFDKGPVIDCFVRPDIDGSDHYPLVLDFDTTRLD